MSLAVYGYVNKRLSAAVKNDVMWHSTVCEIWRKKCDVITKDSAICSVALSRKKNLILKCGFVRNNGFHGDLR